MVVYKLKRFILPVLHGWTVAVLFFIKPCPALTQVPGTEAALDPQVVRGTEVVIEGPPSDLRDADRKDNSAEFGETILAPRRALAGGAYQEARSHWLMTQMPDVEMTEMVAAIRKRYAEVVLVHVKRPKIERIEIEHLTFRYPPRYYENTAEVSVPVRRLTIHATDHRKRPRHVVAYYANYDSGGSSTVVLQVNGHFGANPSRLGLGLIDRGGYSGAALGKLAMQGVPLLTYDDHDVGESSAAIGDENGLHRTLANLTMIDDALLVHIDHVDVLGLSGGSERLYHFSLFHRCQIRSAYFAGYFSALWTALDNKERTGGPFGTNDDTYNEPFLSQFQWADLTLVAIDHIPHVAFANNACEGAISKAAYIHELLPALRRYTTRFQSRGGDPDCDGVSNSGRNLAHEYDLVDFLDFLKQVNQKGK